MRRILIPIALACAVALGGCSWFRDHLGMTAEGNVATVEATYTTLAAAALGYVELPRCGQAEPTNGALCSEPAVVADIKTVDNAAYSAVKAAREAAQTPAGDPTRLDKALAAAKASVEAMRSTLARFGIKAGGSN